MIIWRKGKGGAGMPLATGYLGKLDVFRIFWDSFSSKESNEKYKLDTSLCYVKISTNFSSEEMAKKHASLILSSWLAATGLKEDDE